MENKLKIIIIIIIVVIAAFMLVGGNILSSGEGPSYNATLLSEKLAVDMSNWHYDKANDIYYQIGLVYCMNPEDTSYESCGIYVPGKYFYATKNSNGTYTCTLKSDGKVGNYTARQAPIVMPIYTPKFSACKAPSEYNTDNVKAYTDAGFIYLKAGCRGMNNAEAPWGVTDLKAAVTYYRFNGDVLPGNTERIFTFGHSGGGAQSAIMGASGNSELYNPYLESIQAAMVDRNGNRLSNAIAGAMCWCPITDPDSADAAYEWNMGQYVRDNSSFAGQLSKDLASEYATYINELGLKDPDGNTLTLEESQTGIYASGSYYDYLLEVTEESLDNFLNYTKFPYSPVNESKTYKTPQDYIDSLNGKNPWIEYDADTNTANITSIEDFVKHCKIPYKTAPAFDGLGRSKYENQLFAIDADGSAHFDRTVYDLIKNNTGKYSKYSDYSKKYAEDYDDDLEKTDSENNSLETRMNMYNPLYYLSDYYDGAGSSDVAQFWRIHSGIEQGDTAQCVELNLYLAVLGKVGHDNVEFATLWEQGHTRAEISGGSTMNFINWVNRCLN